MSQPTPLPDDAIDLDDPEVQAWSEEHMTVLRQGAYGQRFLYFTLAGAFVVGFAERGAETRRSPFRCERAHRGSSR
jgi:hypothetical protein